MMPIQKHGHNYSIVYFIFTVLGKRGENKKFWNQFFEINLLFVSSWMKFWFVSIVSKYVNSEIL